MSSLLTSTIHPLTIVLVTDQFLCKRLIVAGRSLAEKTGTELQILSIANPNVAQNPEAIEYLYQISRENNGAMMVHYSDTPEKEISRILKELKPGYVVTGVPQQENSLLQHLWTRFDYVSFYTVDHEDKLNVVTLGTRIFA